MYENVFLCTTHVTCCLPVLPIKCCVERYPLRVVHLTEQHYQKMIDRVGQLLLTIAELFGNSSNESPFVHLA